MLIGAITAGLMTIVADFWSVKNIQVKFHTEAAKDINYQIFYASKPDKSFSEAESVKKTVKAGKHDVKITLPARKIFKFRIDPGQNPGKVVLSDIRLEGRSTLNIDDGNKFIYQNHIDDKKIEGGTITLVSSRNDPYLVYKEKFELKAGREIDFCLFVISLFFALFVSTKSVNYLAKFKILELRSRIDIVFLACFFALLFVPMSRISDEEKSEQENRMLAKFPTRQSIKTASDFSKQFEAWFNDRFLGRDDFIKIYNFMDYKINNKMENEKALGGKDGWLYTKLFNSQAMYQNANLFSDKELEQIGKNLSAFIAKAQAAGVKQVYFYLSNDKESLYAEFYPDYVSKKNPFSRLEQLLDFVHTRYPNIKFFNFIEKMQQIKSKGETLFCKTGTHMNNMGSYYEYYFLMSEIAKDFPELKILQLSDFNITEAYECDTDIYKALKPDFYSKENLKNKKLTLKNQGLVKSKRLRIITVNPLENAGSVVLFENTQGMSKIKAFSIGDSFSGRYTNYMSVSFNSVYRMFFGHGLNFQFFEEDAKYLYEEKPEVLLVETTERFLQRFLHLKFPENPLKD